MISRYNTTADALSVNFGISNILLKDLEYNKNADNLIRTGQVRKYLVLKNVKIVKKADGIVIEKLRKDVESLEVKLRNNS